MEFFATCPSGFEQLLGDELRALGAQAVRPLKGQVAFVAPYKKALEICLWSRLASRVVAVLDRVGAGSSDELYESLRALNWEDHIDSTTSIAIDASGTNAELRTTQFVALRSKDAIVDRIRSARGTRPLVDTASPDLRIVVRISRNRATVGIDLVGEPLFRRGYERDTRGLRADYAAALLTLGNWHKAASGSLLLDAHADRGILLVEAASMAARQAPGLLRTRWGFTGWLQHDDDAWQSCVSYARGQFVEHPDIRLATLRGRSTAFVRALRTAGIDADVQAVSNEGIATLGHPALVACDLIVSQDDFVGQSERVSSLLQAIRSTPSRTVTFSRDGLPTLALKSEPLQTVSTKLGRDEALLCAYGEPTVEAPQAIALPNGTKLTPLVSASDQFAARLKKVARLRARWAKREYVSCYRVYDADLPDYALTIDLFAGCDPKTMLADGRRWLQVFEYAPPKDIDPTLAHCRLLDALAIASATLDVPPRSVFVRVRRHGKGGSQYAAEASKPYSKGGRTKKDQRLALPPGAHLIDEGGLVFEVNFSTRLDCGIFLDHRDTRALLREMAKKTKGSKRFLNLFAYTGTATCYAADGGMIHTTTVDLSRPSLDWARRNMERNGFAGSEHEYVQADVIRWVGEQRHSRNRWDLIFCDVPTFSNSSRMRGRSFDVQRDHTELLISLSRLLTRNGTCVFSCNLRTFEPDAEKLARAKVQIEDITEQTIPEDFARNRRVHHTYLVRRTGDQ